MNEVTTKVCTKCKQEKPVGEFHRNKKAKDGRSCHCKECNYSYHRTLEGKKRHAANMKSYMFKRRKEDPEFNERCKKASREYYRRKKAQKEMSVPDDAPVLEKAPVAQTDLEKAAEVTAEQVAGVMTPQETVTEETTETAENKWKV